MAEKKKKAYQRFEELTGKATGRPRSDADPGSTGTVDPTAAGDTVSVRLNPEVRRALVHQAKLDGCTPSELIEEALRRYLGLPR